MTEDKSNLQKLWDRSCEAEERQSQGYDRAIITLSAGALAISVTYLQDIAPEPVHKWVLGLSWACLGLSLLASLGSMLTSQHAHRRHRQILDALLADKDEGDANTWSDVTNGLNWASSLTFALGVIFLFAFCFVNLR
jgi:hypothetical protein